MLGILDAREKHGVCLGVADYRPLLLCDKEPSTAKCSCLAPHVIFPSDTAHTSYFFNYGLITKNCLKQIKWYIIYSGQSWSCLGMKIKLKIC